jgi:hypothetical protein
MTVKLGSIEKTSVIWEPRKPVPPTIRMVARVGVLVLDMTTALQVSQGCDQRE